MVTLKQIKSIKPGRIVPFICASDTMFSVAATLSEMKHKPLPKGVVGYEHEKCHDAGVLLIHAMGEGEPFVLNGKSRKIKV